MSTMDKALQVGTLVAISAGILACAPQKNANLLPTNSIVKTQIAEVSVPLKTVTFANSNPIEHEQPNTILIAQRSISTSVPKPREYEPNNANDGQSLGQIAKLNQVTTIADQQPAQQLQQTPQLQQQSAYTFYGNPDQPGYQIQTAIFALFEQGIGLEEAAQQVINLVINQNQVISDALAMSAVAEQPNLSVKFVLNIAQLTALIDATKRAMEENPSEIKSIVSLGVTLYPDYARDIITAAALSGEMTEEEAILLAIAAGADPTLLATSTASGADGQGLSAFSATPLGSGVGAGGTGGGDTTASTN